ncbi:MAG: alanine racemase [Clostridiales bacterium]
MKKQELATPAVLVDLDVLENNLKKYQELCNKHGKELWPMTKTHKSTEIAKMQKTFGATGFLGGTLDECEAFCDAGMETIMYAYPAASQPNLSRVIALAQKCHFIIRLDCMENARAISEAAAKAGVTVNYTIIVDSGLHRFGVAPEKVLDFANALRKLPALCFKGISSHPGHVYGAQNHDELAKYVADERSAMAAAAADLKEAGYTLEIVSSGSTPTFAGSIADENIKIFHPGNYVFHDAIQLSIEAADESECALTVYATIISKPREDMFIIDAGSKCFGLDQGAHGNSSISGFGRVKGHPQLSLAGLSEEVGKLKIQGETQLKVGDKIEIIPNHSCVPANLTSFLVGCRQDNVEKTLAVDIRENSKNPVPGK